MKKIITISLTFLIWGNVICQEASFKDERDGKVYKTVKIGDQVWMQENLVATTFRNGDPIPNCEGNYDDYTSNWYHAWKNKKPCYCYSDSSKKHVVYNAYALLDKREIAPKNWHVAAIKEWKILLETNDINLDTIYYTSNVRYDVFINETFKILALSDKLAAGRFPNNGFTAWWTSREDSNYPPLKKHHKEIYVQKKIMEKKHMQKSHLSIWFGGQTDNEGNFPSSFYEDLSTKGQGHYIRCIKN